MESIQTTTYCHNDPNLLTDLEMSNFSDTQISYWRCVSEREVVFWFDAFIPKRVDF